MQRIAELDDIIRENRLEVEGISERFAAAYTRAVEANTGLDYYKDLNRVSQAADVIKNMKRFAISECSISFPEDDITAAKRVLRDKESFRARLVEEFENHGYMRGDVIYLRYYRESEYEALGPIEVVRPAVFLRTDEELYYDPLWREKARESARRSFIKDRINSVIAILIVLAVFFLIGKFLWNYFGLSLELVLLIFGFMVFLSVISLFGK